MADGTQTRPFNAMPIYVQVFEKQEGRECIEWDEPIIKKSQGNAG